MTTPKENNPVWTLFFAYFVPCDLIHQHYQRMVPRFYDPETQEAAAQEFFAYIHLWLSLLYVVADGFKELKLSDAAASPIIDAHLDELRVFRNQVFHFQKKTYKREQFHGVDQFNWAEKLHTAFQKFFTSQEDA